MNKLFIAQNLGGGVKVTIDPGVLAGITLQDDIVVYYQNSNTSIFKSLFINQNTFTKTSFIIKENIFDYAGWGIQITVPNNRAAKYYDRYQMQMSINGTVIDGTAGGQKDGDTDIYFSAIYYGVTVKSIEFKIIYTDNYVCDEDVIVNLASGANTQIFCPSFMPNMQYKFIFEIGGVIDAANSVTPGAGKHITDALTISNGSNKLFVSILLNVTVGILYLQYDSDDNIFLYTSSEGLGFYTSITLTGVIAVPMTTRSPGYVTLDFNDGFIDRYDPYYTDVKNWQEVADFIWADSINNNQVNLQITTTDDLYFIYPEKVSSDGRYLYFNVTETLGTDVYIETVLYQDTVIGEEFEYQNPNPTTYIGNYIANKGMRGAIENSALVLKES